MHTDVTADARATRSAPAAVLVYATFPSAVAAEAVAVTLVREGLVACANILPGLVSVYTWDGALQREAEAAMVAKTRAALGEAVTARIRALHSYDNPAIVLLPVVGGSAEFLAWVAGQTAVQHSPPG